MRRKKRLTVADFFCGAGGFSEGFRQKGFDVVFALDNWQPAIDTHALNHPECKAVKMDILELDTPEKINDAVPDVDVMIGSPPCVAFSGSNKAGKADKSLGLQLIEAYLRIVAVKKSRGKLKRWILENVPNSGEYVKERYTWKELGLPGKGPDLEIPQRGILDASKYGVPQARKRFFCGDFPMPEEPSEKQVFVSKVIDTLKNPLSEKIPSKIKDPVYGFTITSKRLTDHFYDSRIEKFEWEKAKRLKVDHGFMGKMPFPDDMDRPSRTVMATMSASTRESMIFKAVNDKGKLLGYRTPTIREVSSFMSFPITYQFEAGSYASKYKLVGNAVCPKLISVLAEAILKRERINPPKGFVHLPDVKPSFDLHGIKRVAKNQKPRRPDARFARHIPNLKVRSLRVELNNLESDFKKGEIVWKCVLHHGCGKNAKKCEVQQKDVHRAIKSNVRFKDFKKRLDIVFKNKFTSSELHQKYCMNEYDSGPEGALKIMKELVDANFSDKESFDNSNRTLSVRKDKIPFKILAGLYACNHFISWIVQK